MSCDRCIDIHKSQREGKSAKSCDCTCHDSFWSATSSSENILLTNQGDTSNGTITISGNDTVSFRFNPS